MPRQPARHHHHIDHPALAGDRHVNDDHATSTTTTTKPHRRRRPRRPPPWGSRPRCPSLPLRDVGPGIRTTQPPRPRHGHLDSPRTHHIDPATSLPSAEGCGPEPHHHTNDAAASTTATLTRPPRRLAYAPHRPGHVNTPRIRHVDHSRRPPKKARTETGKEKGRGVRRRTRARTRGALFPHIVI